MPTKWWYESTGFALPAERLGSINVLGLDVDRVCLMCGCSVPAAFRNIHRIACVLPKPFIVTEYARALGVPLENVSQDPPQAATAR